jgi:hypothetical protein
MFRENVFFVHPVQVSGACPAKQSAYNRKPPKQYRILSGGLSGLPKVSRKLFLGFCDTHRSLPQVFSGLSDTHRSLRQTFLRFCDTHRSLPQKIGRQPETFIPAPRPTRKCILHAKICAENDNFFTVNPFTVQPPTIRQVKPQVCSKRNRQGR